MSDHDDIDAPTQILNVILTGNHRNDITALSTLLTGQQPAADSISRDKTKTQLSLLSNISAVLTLGNDNSPVAHSVHAVTGTITKDTVECIVCAENKEQVASGNSVPSVPPNGRLEIIQDAGKASSGADLLSNWESDQTRNYTLKEHLRDVFQILSHLSACSPIDPGFTQFDYFIHRRAFRKISWRIRELNLHWGRSPFQILYNQKLPFVKTSPNFTISLTEGEYALLKTQKFPFFEPLFPSGKGSVEVEVHVNIENIQNWLRSLAALFNQLRDAFPIPPKVNKSDIKAKKEDKLYSLPKSEDVLYGVVCIQCILKLKHIIKYILSVRGVEGALHEAENDVLNKKIQEGNNESTDYLSKFKLPTEAPPSTLDNYIFPNRQKQLEIGPVQAPSSSQTGENEERQAVDNMDDVMYGQDEEGEREDMFPEVVHDLSIKATSANRLMTTIYAIAAWHVAVNALSQKVKMFAGLEMKVLFYDCDSIPHEKYNVTFRGNLARMFPSVPLTHNQAEFQRLLKTWAKAKLHAEALLMGWIFAEDQNKKDSNQRGERKEVPIAVSKRCCFLCWSLHKKLNKRSSLDFLLPGTHNIIFGWIPPLEVPDDVLAELRQELLDVYRTVTTGHSRQSSADSSVSDVLVRPPAAEQALISIVEKKAKSDM